MENLVIQKSGNNYKYVRNNSNEYLKLSTLISDFYNNPSILVPSGMSAIATSINVILSINKNKKVNIVYSSELYCETKKTILWLDQDVALLLDL